MKIYQQKYSKLEYVLFFIVLTGIVAALVDLAHNRSLWLDEAMLSLNIVNKSYRQLLLPLGMNQVAPIGFLIVQKFLSSLFGNQDWSLKMLPIFSYLLSIPLLFRISMSIFQSRSISLLTCALFSTNIFIIRYASEVKQYSTDILAMLLILNLAFEYSNQNIKKYIFKSALLGSIIIWFSNIAIIGLFVLGLYLLYKRIDNKHQSRNAILFPIIFWSLSFALYYRFFIYGHPTKTFMVEYWTLRNAFLPINIFSKAFYFFLFTKMKMIFPFLLGFKYNWLLSLLCFFLGILQLVKQRKILFFLLMPGIVHLILSGFQLYPFDKRTILYIIPGLMLLISAGIMYTYNFIIRKGIKIPSLILSIILFLNLIHLFKKVPSENEEIKKCLNYIHDNIDIKDHLFVYFVSEPAYLFYMKSYPKLNSLQYSVLGDWKMKTWENFDKEIVSTKGKSWLVFTEVYDIGRVNGEQFIIDRIAKEGGRILSKRKFTGASCYEVFKQ